MEALKRPEDMRLHIFAFASASIVRLTNEFQEMWLKDDNAPAPWSQLRVGWRAQAPQGGKLGLTTGVSVVVSAAELVVHDESFVHDE